MSDNKTIIAGVCGIVIGALFASASTDNRERFRALDTKLGALEQRLAEIGTAAEATAQSAEGAALESRAAQAALGTLGERIEPLASGQERLRADQAALADSVSGGLAALEKKIADLTGLETQIADLGEVVRRSTEDLDTRITALGLAPVRVPAAGTTDPAAAAAEGGATRDERVPEGGLALDFGASGMIGDTRVFLSRRAGQDVVLALPGGRTVATGPDAGDAALGNGCTVALAEVVDRTAYLTVDCAASATPTVTALAPAASPPIVGIAADAETLSQRVGEGGLALGFGESAMLGGERVTLSRMDGADAVLRRAGAGDVRIGPDAGALDLGDGCLAVLAGMAERRVYIARLCDGENLLAAAVPSSSAPSGDASAAGIGGDTVTVAIGQAFAVGDARLFLSRRHGSDAVLRVAGAGDIVVGPEAGPAQVGGCELTLIGMDGNRGIFRPDC